MAVKLMYALILVTQNAMTAIPKQVPAWEVDLYREKFGDTVDVIETGIEVEAEDYPDTAIEAERLIQMIGADPETRQNYFHLVYGRGERGLDALEAAITSTKSRRTAKPARAKPAAVVNEPAVEPAGDGEGAGDGADPVDPLKA